MRRTLIARKHVPVDGQTDPSISYSPFGWNYALPQNMTAPFRPNRSMPVPRTSLGFHKALGVWIDCEIHPAFRVALDPYLRKLPLTRIVPATTADTAINDFNQIGVRVGDTASRHGYLAKVLQLCAMRKSVAGYVLWQSQCESYLNGEVPSAALAKSVLYLLVECRHDDWKTIFTHCMKHKWDLTPKFCMALWNKVLRCAADKRDEQGVRMILEEMHDVQVAWTNVGMMPLVTAFNAIISDEGYVWFKQFLFNIEMKKITSIAKYYTATRSRIELKLKIPEAQDNDVVLPENDRVYYHVQWHNRIRSPMHFTPRQLYFDYFPQKESSDVAAPADPRKERVPDLVRRKVKAFQLQGLLPEDYDYFRDWMATDYGENHDHIVKTVAPHKHKPPRMFRNHPGYDVILAGKK